MNYGKFFRLNLKESKIVEKVAVYDYIDLPAYFGKSKKMSPKYPITLCITGDSLRFRLHYCAYLDEDGNYFYESVNKQGSIETVHMQEVILEIPFTNYSMRPISGIIKQLYLNRFPFSTPYKGEGKVKDSQCSIDGDLFLANLLFYRYDERSEENLSPVYRQLYSDLRCNVDADSSYSSLWLMGLKENLGEGRSRIDLKDGIMDGPYVGVLRKILLDFMFDLKHSEVFQTSSSYLQMYSGLMSDFFFRALMHKCEYYYYRGLTLDAISKVESSSTQNKTGRRLDNCINVKGNLCIGCLDMIKQCLAKNNQIIADEKKKSFLRIQELYAAKLFEAEKEWVEDILDPQAERLFQSEDEDFKSIDKKSILQRQWAWIKRNLGEPLRNGSFITRKDWFADPEEELRRVCFTMREVKKTKVGKYTKKHSCNAETVAEYLSLQNRDGIGELRSRISRWFLKRNAFLDILHLHYFKVAHVLIPLFFIALAGLFIFDQSFFSQESWQNNHFVAPIVLAIWGICLVVSIYFWIRKSKKPHPHPDEEVLVGIKTMLVGKRMFWWMLVTGSGLFFLYAAIYANQETKWISPLIIAVSLCIVAIFMRHVAHVQLIRNVHLLFPRLLASIAAAWLTLAIGNELFQSFFDTIPSWLSCTLLSVIVLIFLVYEMNRIVPKESAFVKFIRSAELLMISFVLSVIVGLFIINFTGERFMERSEYLGTFYKEYVGEGKKNSTNTKATYRQDYYYSGDEVYEGKTTNDEYLNDLQNLTVVRQGEDKSQKKPVATYWIIGKYRFFILRDFLIQFAFLAMFIGVFIQMIFEEKSITEM